MKTYWRCFVCNDIHYGVKPPEICPTCKVRAAYVAISEREARLILGAEGGEESGADDFRRAIEAFTAENEFQVNPDRARVDLLVQGIFENAGRYGLKYCPCRLRSADFVEDLKIVCPCNFFIHETYKDKPAGECWCGLFKRR